MPAGPDGDDRRDPAARTGGPEVGGLGSPAADPKPADPEPAGRKTAGPKPADPKLAGRKAGGAKAGGPPRDPAEAWNIFGTLIAGMAFWGLVGFGLDRLLGFDALFLPIGLLLGIAASMYLVIYRLGRRS